MRIGNGHFQPEALYEKQVNSMENFSDTMNKIRNRNIGARDSYVKSTGYSNLGVYTKDRIAQDLKLPLETERYRIEDATYTEGVPAYDIIDKETGKSLYIREDELAIQKDEKTGMEFLINMDQPFSYNVTITNELKSILNDLAEERNIDIKEIPLQGGLAVNQDPKTGLKYLSMRGNEAQGISLIITSEKDLETFHKLVDEFQEYSVSSQQLTAGLYALLEISGNLTRENEGFTYLTPDGIRYIPFDGNPDKAWEIDMPLAGYSTARKYMTAGNNCANLETWMKIFQGMKGYYGDAQKSHSYKVDDLGRYCVFHP